MWPRSGPRPIDDVCAADSLTERVFVGPRTSTLIRGVPGSIENRVRASGCVRWGIPCRFSTPGTVAGSPTPPSRTGGTAHPFHPGTERARPARGTARHLVGTRPCRTGRRAGRGPDGGADDHVRRLVHGLVERSARGETVTFVKCAPFRKGGGSLSCGFLSRSSPIPQIDSHSQVNRFTAEFNADSVSASIGTHSDGLCGHASACPLVSRRLAWTSDYFPGRTRGGP